MNLKNKVNKTKRPSLIYYSNNILHIYIYNVFDKPKLSSLI